MMKFVDSRTYNFVNILLDLMWYRHQEILCIGVSGGDEVGCISCTPFHFVSITLVI